MTNNKTQSEEEFAYQIMGIHSRCQDDPDKLMNELQKAIIQDRKALLKRVETEVLIKKINSNQYFKGTTMSEEIIPYVNDLVAEQRNALSVIKKEVGIEE